MWSRPSNCSENGGRIRCSVAVRSSKSVGRWLCAEGRSNARRCRQNRRKCDHFRPAPTPCRNQQKGKRTSISFFVDIRRSDEDLFSVKSASDAEMARGFFVQAHGGVTSADKDSTCRLFYQPASRSTSAPWSDETIAGISLDRMEQLYAPPPIPF